MKQVNPILVLVIALSLALKAEAFRVNDDIAFQKGEIIEKYVSEIFEGIPRPTEQANADPYSTDNKGAVYSEWKEKFYAALPEGVQGCRLGRSIPGDSETELTITLLCQQQRVVAVLTYDIKNDRFKEPATLWNPPSTTNKPQTDYVLGDGFVGATVGYETANQPRIFIYPEAGEPVKLSFPTSEPEFTYNPGIGLLKIPKPTQTPASSSNPGALPTDSNVYLVIYEKARYEDLAARGNVLAVTWLQDNLKESTTKFIELPKLKVENPRILDIVIVGTELRIAYTGLNQETNFSAYAVCTAGIEKDPEAKSHITLACESLTLEYPNIPTKPSWILSEDKTQVALIGDSNDGVEILLCQVNGALVATGCIANTEPVNANPDLRANEIRFTGSGTLVANYVNPSEYQGRRLPPLKLIVRDIKKKADKDELEFKADQDPRSLIYLAPLPDLLIEVRRYSYSVYGNNPDKATIVFTADELELNAEGQASVKVTRDDGKSVDFRVRVVENLVTESSNAELPSLTLYQGQTEGLPIDRTTFTGNALEISLAKQDPEATLTVFDRQRLNLKITIAEATDVAHDVRLVTDTTGFVIIQNEDENRHLYFLTCQINEEDLECAYDSGDLSRRVDIGKKTEFYSVQQVTNPNRGGAVATLQEDGVVYFAFWDKREGKFNAFVERQAEGAAGLHFFQGENQTAILFVAFPEDNVVRGYRVEDMNFAEAKKEEADRYDIKAGFAGIVGAKSFCPKYVTACAFSDSFLEVGSVCDGEARVFKWNLKNLEEPKFDDAVPFNNQLLNINQKDVTFCPTGVEFTVFQPNTGVLYGKDTQNDQSFVNYGASQFDVDIVQDVLCVRKQSVAAVVGANGAGTKRYILTYNGNRAASVNNRVHSRITIPNNARISASAGQGTVNYLVQEPEEPPYVERVYLSGPIAHYKPSAGATEAKIDVSYAILGDEEKKTTFTYSASIGTFNDDFKIEAKGKNAIKVGFNNFDEVVAIEGNVFTADLEIPPGLRDKVTFVPRIEDVTPEPAPTRSRKNADEQILGLRASGEVVAYAYIEEARETKIDIFTEVSKPGTQIEERRICDHFDFDTSGQLAVVVLGCYDGNRNRVRIIGVEDVTEQSTEVVEITTQKISGLQVREVGEGVFIASIWLEHKNEVYLEKITLEVDQGALSIKTERVDTIYDANSFQTFARVDETTLALVYGDSHASGLTVKVIGRDNLNPQKVALETTGEIQEIRCAWRKPPTTEDKGVNVCSAILVGVQNVNFELAINDSTGKPTIEKFRNWQNYKDSQVVAVQTTSEYTVFEATGQNTAGLLLYSSDLDQYLRWGVKWDQYVKEQGQRTRYQLIETDTGETRLLVWDRTEAANDIGLRTYNVQNWGVEAKEGFGNEDGLDVKITFKGYSGEEKETDDLTKLFDKDFKPKPDPENKSFFQKYWWIFVILIILILVGVVYYFVQKSQDDDDDDEGKEDEEDVEMNPYKKAKDDFE